MLFEIRSEIPEKSGKYSKSNILLIGRLSMFICFMEIEKIEGNGRNELFYFEKRVSRQVSIPDWRVICVPTNLEDIDF